MQRFRTVLAYVPRYRIAITLGILSVLIGQVLQNYSPQLLRGGLREIEVGAAPGETIDTSRVQDFAIAYLVVMLFRAFFLWSMRYFTVTASRRIEADLRLDFFKHLQSLDAQFFNRNRTGDLMSRATSDLEAVRSALGPAVMYISNSVFSVPLALAFMFSMDWVLTLIALAPLILIAVLVKALAPAIMAGSRRAQEAMGRLSTSAQEDFAGVRVVKAYAREESEERRFDAHSQDYVSANLELARIRGFMSGGIHSMGTTGILIVLAYCGFTMMGYTLAGRKLDLATLIAFQAYQMNLVWPMMAFGWVLAMFQRGAAALERIDAVMGTEPAVADSGDELQLETLPDGISITNLDFAYTPGEPVLSGIDLVVPPRATLGIVGPTGSGKSTLLSMILRTHPLPRGKVAFGEVDACDVSLDLLRREIAVVPQEAFLFSQTVAQNIAFGHDLESVGMERVEHAAQVAALAKDIEDLPRGFETRVGERGVTLSGGQKQRVAIARAVLRDPRILVLDDCLSAVDSSTEREILDGLLKVIAGRTTIIVAHRLSAVMRADQIVVVEDGHIVDRGRHTELLARSGYYADTWRRQQLEEELGELE